MERSAKGGEVNNILDDNRPVEAAVEDVAGVGKGGSKETDERDNHQRQWLCTRLGSAETENDKDDVNGDNRCHRDVREHACSGTTDAGLFGDSIKNFRQCTGQDDREKAESIDAGNDIFNHADNFERDNVRLDDGITSFF